MKAETQLQASHWVSIRLCLGQKSQVLIGLLKQRENEQVKEKHPRGTVIQMLIISIFVLLKVSQSFHSSI